MKIEELSLIAIDGQRHLVTSENVVAAVAYAVRRGYGNVTAYRFVTALVMTDQLRGPLGQWPVVLKKIRDLGLDADLAALEIGETITGEIEGS